MLLLIILSLVASASCSYQQEKLLQETLLTDYNKYVRPQKGNDPVQVYFDMRLKNLVKLDLREQVLVINCFTMLRWTDPQLQWNMSAFNGTDRINMDSSLIWTPDIMLYNTAELTSFQHTDMYKTRPLVFNKGLVVWNSPVTWKISCELDVTWFPVDRQVCNFTFGSNSYSKSQLDLRFWSKPSSKAEIVSSNFLVEGGEWNINSLTSHETNINFICCPEDFSIIRYRIELSRMSLYYFLYIILPLVSLSFLFLLVFHIPHDSGERMGFGVTILLSITVYLLVISEKLPEKSDVYPMLGICFIVVFYILCTALAFAATTTIFAKRTSKPPNFLLTWLKKLKLQKNKKKIEPKNSMSMTSVDTLKNMNETSNKKEEEENDAEKENYNDEWMEICRYCDKRFFFVFNALLILIPVIIICALPRDRLA